ncbi:MAG: hypothetical protein ABFR05_08205 [Bacteroidota bacterium]
MIEDQDQGKLSGIKLLHNYVHDVKGEMDKSEEGSQTDTCMLNGEILMVKYPTSYYLTMI